MEPSKQYYKPSELVTLFYLEGYRSGFKLFFPNKKRDPILGSTGGIINDFLAQYRSGKESLLLETYARYRSDKNYLKCIFRIEYNKREGFQIHEMTLQDAKNQQLLQYIIKDKRDIPSVHDIMALFPRKNANRKKDQRLK